MSGGGSALQTGAGADVVAPGGLLTDGVLARPTRVGAQALAVVVGVAREAGREAGRVVPALLRSLGVASGGGGPAHRRTSAEGGSQERLRKKRVAVEETTEAESGSRKGIF